MAANSIEKIPHVIYYFCINGFSNFYPRSKKVFFKSPATKEAKPGKRKAEFHCHSRSGQY
jgi:hypothetical protein